MFKITDKELSEDLKNQILFNNKNNLLKPIIPTIYGRTLTNIIGRAGNGLYKLASNEHVNPSCIAYENDIIKLDIDPDTTDNISFINYYRELDRDRYVLVVAEILSPDGGECSCDIGTTTIERKKKTTSESSKFTICYSASKITDKIPDFEYFINVVGLQCSVRYRNLRTYYISEEEYNKIDVDPEYTGYNLSIKFPYVDDTKPIINPIIENRENLLENIKYFRGSNADYTGLLNIPDDSSLWVLSYPINVKYLQTYTLSLNIPPIDKKYKIQMHMFDGNKYDAVDISNNIQSFVSTGNIVRLVVAPVNKYTSVPDTVIDGLINSTLVKGNTSKSYDECCNSYIKFDTTLYDGETISRDINGNYVKNTIYKDVTANDIIGLMLDETRILPRVNYHRDGFKVIEVGSVNNIYGKNTSSYECTFVGFDGKILKKQHKNADQYTLDDINCWLIGNGDNLLICLPNNLTGWGDDYTPTPEEIKAFFLGWTMYYYESVSNPNDLYNGIGQKSWTKIWCGVGGRLNIHGVNICLDSNINVTPTKMNDQGYTPYKLIYKLDKPTIGKVQTYGTLFSCDNDNIISYSNIFELYGKYGKVTFEPCLSKQEYTQDVLNNHIKEIKSLINKPLSINDNLLINSNFKNPVNQRRINDTSDIGDGYFIDRFGTYNLNVSTSHNGLIVKNIKNPEIGYGTLYQYVENDFDGQLLSLSIKINGKVYSGSIYVNTVVPGQEIDSIFIENIGTLSAFKLSSHPNCTIFQFAKLNTYDDYPIIIEWVKMEVGNISTPFVPKMYQEELLMCQRYFNMITSIRIPPYATSPTDMWYIFKFNIMRITPTVSVIGQKVIDCTTLHQVTDDMNLITNDVKIMSFISKFSYTTISNLNNGYMSIDKILLDAEIY